MADNRATELLRKLLDERGVKWTSKPTHPETTWAYNGWWHNAKFEPWSDSTFKVTIYDLTPEQAIAATLGSGTLTAEQVREAIEKRLDFDVWVPKERWQAIADELNAALGSGTCELDYDRHCSNCGVHVHEDAVLVRKHLDGGTWTVVSKPASFCPNCGARIRKAVKR